MTIQSRTNNTNYTFVLNGTAVDRDDQTIQQDAGRTTVIAPFTMLGKIRSSVATTGTADAGNTGDGTVTAVAKLAAEPIAQVGAYNLELITIETHGGTFKLEGPGGELISNNIVMEAASAGATTIEINGMTMLITDGATDFIVGDKFAITVTAVNKLVPIDPSAVDGSQFFHSIYTQAAIPAADIVAGDVADIKVITGGKACIIDEDQLVFENSVTIDTQLQDGRTVREAMAAVGIFTSETQDISNFENV